MFFSRTDFKWPLKSYLFPAWKALKEIILWPFLRMLTHFVIPVPCVDLEVWNVAYHSVNRDGERLLPFISALYLLFLKLWTPCSERHPSTCNLSGWLTVRPWGQSDALAALKIATAPTVLVGVQSRPGDAVFLSAPGLHTCLFLSYIRGHSSGTHSLIWHDGGAPGPCVAPRHWWI